MPSCKSLIHDNRLVDEVNTNKLTTLGSELQLILDIELNFTCEHTHIL